MDRGAKKEDDDESSRMECQLSHLPGTENEGEQLEK